MIGDVESERVALILLGERGHQGSCCDCCNGYCPSGDIPGQLDELHGGQVYPVTVDGVEYATDRYRAIRKDLVGPLEPPTWAVGPRVTDTTRAGLIVPDVQPPVSRADQSMDMLDRLAQIEGLTVHEGQGPALNLYVGSEHVGWCGLRKWQQGAASNEDYPLVRRIADAIGVSLDRAETALFVARGGEV
jgi:hypothetical protein